MQLMPTDTTKKQKANEEIIGEKMYINSTSKARSIRYATIVIILMFVLILAISIRALTWAYQSSDVLDIKNQPFPTRTIREHPTANGVVFLDIDYCKKVNAEGRVRTSFVSQSKEVFLPVSFDRQPPICQRVEIPITIPKDLEPDKYKVCFRTEYKVNPLKDSEFEEFCSQEFEVVQ